MESTTAEPVPSQPYFGDHNEHAHNDGLRPATRPEPTRQTLFPVAGQAGISLESLRDAENLIRSLGFNVMRLSPSQWQIDWPDSVLRIWRYSAEEVCHFARDQAGDYARRARLSSGGDN
ncbi:hypothetical protein [Hydrocarboniclastica marina]|uniref:Uncharacterized protein n=1 Tax=Hydrocarboniclastica marina TaxID=2259620 RepID=A0A4P7XFX7_9ALTE|nr:hypothetical protein [Hydrocarboniclastica marina]QCF25344.1 hypothetical protein soil367_05020 [Hydrocarboniclastica marina]